MRLIYSIILLIISFHAFPQKVFQEIKRLSFNKLEYNRSNHRSQIDLQLFKIYEYPDSTNFEQKLVITTVESKNEEIGSSKGFSMASSGRFWALGLSDDKLYKKDKNEGYCEISEKELPQLVKTFNSVMVSAGNLKIAHSNEDKNNILIIESFKNIEIGGELVNQSLGYYFKIDQSVYKFELSEFYEIAKFLRSYQE